MKENYTSFIVMDVLWTWMSGIDVLRISIVINLQLEWGYIKQNHGNGIGWP